MTNRSLSRSTTASGTTGSKGKIVLLGGFLGAFILSIQPVSMMLANLQYYGAKNYLDEWQADPSQVNESQIAIAKQYAAKAIDLHPSFALYTDTLSNVLQWEALGTKSTSLRNELLNEAEALNLTSLQHRPSWPVTWANLVYVKSLKNQFDDSFQNYLSNASFFGPNSPEVHTVVASVGLSLPERNVRVFLANKDVIKNHVVLGLEHSKAKKAVIDSVLATNKQALVCSWLKAKAVSAPKPFRCS